METKEKKSQQDPSQTEEYCQLFRPHCKGMERT